MTEDNKKRLPLLCLCSRRTITQETHKWDRAAGDLKIELCLGIDVSFGCRRPGSSTALERRPGDLTANWVGGGLSGRPQNEEALKTTLLEGQTLIFNEGKQAADDHMNNKKTLLLGH